MKAAGVDPLENFPTEQIGATFAAMLDDSTNETFDSFAAPQKTGTPYGCKNANNTAKLTRARELATGCVGLKGDLNLRTVGLRGQGNRQAVGTGDHEGRRQVRDAGLLPPIAIEATKFCR